MKKRTKLVLEILKPKVKALGFNKDELESVAADIADNLGLEEEASDEDVNAKAEEATDAAIPYLKLAQKASNRVIQSYKDEQQKLNEEKPEKPEGENKKPIEEKKDNPPVDKKPQETEVKTPEWVQELKQMHKEAQDEVKALKAEVLGLKAERETDARRTKLKGLLKDTGTFGKAILKSFDKMKFENDAEFTEYYDGVVENINAINQERANEGLKKLGAPEVPKKEEPKKPEILSEQQIEELANTLVH